MTGIFQGGLSVAGCDDELQVLFELQVLLGEPLHRGPGVLCSARRPSACPFVCVMEAPARINLPKLFLSLSSLLGRWTGSDEEERSGRHPGWKQ